MNNLKSKEDIQPVLRKDGVQRTLDYNVTEDLFDNF